MAGDLVLIVARVASLRNLQAAAKLTFSKLRKSAGCIKWLSSDGL